MMKSIESSMTNTWGGVKTGAQQRGKNPVNINVWVFLLLSSSFYCFSALCFPFVARRDFQAVVTGQGVVWV